MWSDQTTTLSSIQMLYYMIVTQQTKTSSYLSYSALSVYPTQVTPPPFNCVPPPFGQFKNKFGDNKENRIPWISSGELRYLPLLLLLLLLLRLKRQCRELGWVQGARVVKDERRQTVIGIDEVQPVTGLQQVKINVVCVGHTYEHSRFKVHSVTKLSQAPGKLHLPQHAHVINDLAGPKRIPCHFFSSLLLLFALPITFDGAY